MPGDDTGCGGAILHPCAPWMPSCAHVRFALANRAIYALMTSRPHATMKHNPPLQTAVHKVVTEAMRIFCRDIKTPAERRRAVMKIYTTLYGGISLYAAVRARPAQREGADRGTFGDERDVNVTRLDAGRCAGHFESWWGCL
jgi:hypothetical protein